MPYDPDRCVLHKREPYYFVCTSVAKPKPEKKYWGYKKDTLEVMQYDPGADMLKFRTTPTVVRFKKSGKMYKSYNAALLSIGMTKTKICGTFYHHRENRLSYYGLEEVELAKL